MTPQPRTRAPRRRLAGAVACLAAVPAIALGAALTTCDCPAHHAAGSPERAMAGHTGGAQHARHASTIGGAAAAMPMAWVVGSERAPLITRNLPGPVLRGDARAVSTVPLAMAARLREPSAGRAALTTAEATAKLSRRCRKLLKAKRPSRLSKAERRKRSACLAQRRALIAASQNQPAGTTPTAAPTPGPGTATPAPTTPSTATPTPSTTPTPAPTSPCAGKNPCVAAVGVTAKDDGAHFYFTVTRATVMADRVSFEFSNGDAQNHNLFVEEKGKPETAQAVSTLLAPGGRVTKELALAPGTYQLRCMLTGHEAMVVDFVVQAPVR